MAKFIAKGIVLVKENFEVEIEASSKIAAKQQLEAKTKEEGGELLSVSFEEVSEASEEQAIVDCLQETEVTDPKEEFAPVTEESDSESTEVEEKEEE